MRCITFEKELQNGLPQLVKDQMKSDRVEAENTPKFNKKKCKNGCNCIDIAEYNNGCSPVMSYQCLKEEEDY